MDECLSDKVYDGDDRVPLSMSDTVNQIFANADNASPLAKQMSGSLEGGDKIFEHEFYDRDEAFEAVANYSLTQVLALRLVCAQLAARVDLLTIASARSRKTTRRTTGGPYRPKN